MNLTAYGFGRCNALMAAIGLGVVSIVLAGPADADTSATVKARTQRMAAPNLTSQQNGWYNVGDRLTLACSTRGQAVKGYFSFNIPNGGWDNLWYKTTDGSFVADVDIETGTFNVVAPDCGASPPVAVPTPPPPTQSNGLRIPLDGTPGIYRGFGNSHNGIDYTTGMNTPVFAADSGMVTFEGWGQNNSWMTGMAGICVLIKHANIYTGYAHLSSTTISNGQQVSKGQLIGYTGRTGAATGPHLHFEVLPLNPNFGDRVYFGRVDPTPFLN